MGTFSPLENTLLIWLPAANAAADIEAPTQAELGHASAKNYLHDDAVTTSECLIRGGISGLGITPTTVDVSDLCTAQNKTARGPDDLGDLTMTYWRDDTNNPIWDDFAVDASGQLFIFVGPNGHAAGQEGIAMELTGLNQQFGEAFDENHQQHIIAFTKQRQVTATAAA